MDISFLPGEKWVLDVPNLTSSCIYHFWGNSVLQLPSPVLSTHASCPGFMGAPYVSLYTKPQEDGCARAAHRKHFPLILGILGQLL